MPGACVRDDFCFNNSELMRRRKSVCDLADWRVCRRPELWKQTYCFDFCTEGRERARYFGLMPSIDVRWQDKNERKFSRERFLWQAGLEPSPRREFTRANRAAPLHWLSMWKSTLIEDFNHYEICPKTLLWGYHPECFHLAAFLIAF